jgi:predicted secreted hydrolase
MRRRAFFASPLLLLARAATGADFPEVTAGHALQFPQDEGSHPAFRNEWWYVTGWLDDAGHSYGFQVTFFRNRPDVAESSPSRFAPRELLFAHAALADPTLGKLRYDERAAREGFDFAAARTGATDVWIGDWSLERAGPGYRARIAARDFTLDLHFASTQQVLLEGDAGLSRKGPLALQASYYYSDPQLAATGRLQAAGRDGSVRGVAWLDHEWSSEYMAPQAVGWDWTGINFDDGAALMAFRMRDAAGGSFWAGGSYRAAGGPARVFAPNEVAFAARRRWRSPRTQVEYPVAMTVRAGDIEYELEPLMDDQELDARIGVGVLYWEGAVRASANGRAIGRGYLELTGYGKPLKL